LAGAFGIAGADGVSAEGASASPLRLRRGVNAWPWFSLTREYPAPRTDYAWPPFQFDRSIPTSSDLRLLRQAGFDFVRIPVDPGPFLAADRAQRQALLADLMAAVRAARTAGLSVVVNLQANAATHYWTPERISGSPAAPEFANYLGLVGQIAKPLSEAAEGGLALEPINEPGGACDNPDYRSVRLALLTKAREAAPTLTLIASGGCGSLIQGLDAFDPTSLQALEPLLFTFHFYEPYLFTHQGAPWMREPIYRSLNGVPWPASAGALERTLEAVRQRMQADVLTPADTKAAAYAESARVLKVYFDAQPARWFIDKYFGAVDAWAKRHRLANEQILLGEFGALAMKGGYAGAAAPDRARYIADVRRSAEAFGFPWAFWSLFGAMGVMDDQARTLDPAIVDALGLNAARG
jgi:hypothetical protein